MDHLSDPDTNHLRAYIEFAVGDYERAWEILRPLLKQYPHSTAYQFDSGLCAWRLQHVEEAAVAFQAAVEADKRFADAHFNLALAHAKLGNRAAARRSFVRAARLNPLLIVAWIKRSRFGATPHDPCAMLERYGWRVALKEFPAVRDAIAAGMLRRGHLTGAEEQLRLALNMEDTAPRRSALGSILQRQKKLPEAREQFQIARDLDSAVANAQHDRGLDGEAPTALKGDG